MVAQYTISTLVEYEKKNLVLKKQYWKSKIPFFNKSMWDTQKVLKFKIRCLNEVYNYFSFLKYFEENTLP